MFGFGRKSFEKLKEVIEENIQAGKFKTATAYYSQFKETYELIEDKDDFYKDFEFISDQLILFMYASDAMRHCYEDDIGRLKDRLDKIEEIMTDWDNLPIKLKDFADRSHEVALKAYKKRLVEKEFVEKLDEVEKLIYEKNFDFAIDKMKELKHLKSNLDFLSGKKNDILDAKMKELNEHLKLSFLEMKAHSEPAIYTHVREIYKKGAKRKK